MSDTDSTDDSSAFNGLRISDLSRLTGIPVSTLRFWCDQNLLVPHVTPSGHRIFEERHVQEVQAIQRLRKIQGLGIAAVKSAMANTALQTSSATTQQMPANGEGTVGHKLRQFRLNAKLTLRELSDATGLSPSVLASIERTSLGVGIPEAKALAKYFGLTLTELNGGLETLASWPDGRVLGIAESLRRKNGNHAVFLREGASWADLEWKPSAGGFLPVDAAVLPNGDLLVLERRWSLLPAPTLSSRVVRVRADSVRPGRVLEGAVVAELTAPFVAENFEGLAVLTTLTGVTYLAVLSDDNFNPAQRTLLLWFELPREGAKPSE